MDEFVVATKDKTDNDGWGTKGSLKTRWKRLEDKKFTAKGGVKKLRTFFDSMKKAQWGSDATCNELEERFQQMKLAKHKLAEMSLKDTLKDMGAKSAGLKLQFDGIRAPAVVAVGVTDTFISIKAMYTDTKCHLLVKCKKFIVTNVHICLDGFRCL